MAGKIASPEDLNAVKERARAAIDLRAGPKETQVTVHMGTCGIAAGARDILAQLVASQASISNVTLRQSGCLGLCEQEPMMTVRDKAGKELRYGKLDKNKIREIIREHLLAGRPVAQYLIKT